VPTAVNDEYKKLNVFYSCVYWCAIFRIIRHM